jgi:hypothetical protein
LNGEVVDEVKSTEEDLTNSVVNSSSSKKKNSMQDEYPSKVNKSIAELAKKSMSIYDA